MSQSMFGFDSETMILRFICRNLSSNNIASLDADIFFSLGHLNYLYVKGAMSSGFWLFLSQNCSKLKLSIFVIHGMPIEHWVKDVKWIFEEGINHKQNFNEFSKGPSLGSSTVVNQ